ncbi:hypothetical protein BO85DRAFT_495258 [Aspergillus piperis CBS 112811]|uniref:Uncharacterized protein n=1 Tax=Aspergillus piperis CBS 112811 TaxID=1448313 RepID=A0A8G1REU9_9EURO|nr:hypothetical protein BO85DRAFT_495258 [Aspergillus piperis CBS 112811]RAH63389.1 hypothetical protein BO85DRAFT_495258 [Aspergillus piperis CBS 112811]
MVADSVMLRLIKEFLQILKDSPEIKAITGYGQAQCVIVGGAAVRCYVRNRSVRNFEMRRDQLVWHTIYDTIRIGILPTDDFATIPKNLQLRGNLDPDDLPVIPLTELIIFKAQACGNRSTEQNERDATDVIELMKLFPGRSFRRRLMDRQWASLQLVKPSLKASKSDYDWDTAF